MAALIWPTASRSVGRIRHLCRHPAKSLLVVVIHIQPLYFTFVCPTELGDVADHYEELQKLGVDVYSVSTDTHFTHKAWH
ncbi:redoxin domain-containing protein, partial [Salmonella enterica subsp. enterica serovar Anatum]|nr:redoxin domain-containing protein [Salmonella enterica subsp. enterica serovar Anatum]